MKTQTWLALPVMLVLLFCGCMNGNEGSTPGTASTVKHIVSTTTIPEERAASSTSSTTSTTIRTITSSTLASTENAGCAGKETALQRDACYLAAALSSGDWTLCTNIERNTTRTLCLSGTEVETDGRSSTVQGYVVYDSNSRPIEDAVVLAVSRANGKAMATDRTDPRGFFSFDLPSMDHYNITVDYRGGRYKQEVFARKGETYELWFRLPDTVPG